MDLLTLTARLKFLGAAVVTEGGRPALRFPDGTPTEGLAAELGPALAAHRDAVLATFGAEREPTSEGTCGECGRFWRVWDDDTDEAYRACFLTLDSRVMCPHWRPGLGPEWMGRARKDAVYQREKKAALDQVTNAPVPD